MKECLQFALILRFHTNCIAFNAVHDEAFVNLMTSNYLVLQNNISYCFLTFLFKHSFNLVSVMYFCVMEAVYHIRVS